MRTGTLPTNSILIWAALLGLCGAFVIGASGCGRASSGLLRQQQLPLNDFPLYLSEGAAGKVWAYSSDGSRRLVAEGLSDPRGLATDRFNHLYVVERGENRLLKMNVDDGSYDVVADGLEDPSVVAVDSFGEPFVAQDAASNVIRASDGKVFGTYGARPSALVFGVSDRMIVGLFDSDVVYWGAGERADSATVTKPVNAAIDGTGRVYVAEGSDEEARVLRYPQDKPGEAKEIAVGLMGPQGIAVDPVGNIYVVEQGRGRVVLIAYDGDLFAWASDLTDPQYLAFSNY